MKAIENRRRYSRRLLIIAVVYTALTLFAGYTTRLLPPGDAWRIPLALLPVLPAAGMLLAAVSFVRRLDELEQRIHLIAAVIVLLAIVLGCITWGFLEAYAGFPALDGFVVGAGGIAGWGLVQALVRRTYG